MKHLDRFVAWVKAAGAPTEASHDRNGFLSYHAETHAVGMGVAAGYTAAAFSEASLLGIVYGTAVHGRIRQSEGKRRRIIADVRQEPHYALGGVVVGGLLGALTRLAIGQSVLPSVASIPFLA